MATRIRPSRRRSLKLFAHSRATSARPPWPAQLQEADCHAGLKFQRAHSPCSKAGLVRLSGLTAATASLAIARIASLGMVEDLGNGRSSGGRPPALLRSNASHGYVAAADIGGTRLRMMLADLTGRPVAQWTVAMTDQQKSPHGVVSLVHTGLCAMMQGAGARDRVLHLTAGAPGITDVSRGVVLAAPNLAGWNSVPLRDLLEAETGLQVIVENDTNLAAVGEHARGAAAATDDFIFVAIGTGVGAGIFLRGALHHGADWSAGEIGYLPVAGAPRCPVRMSEMGPLERRLGGNGIETQWQQSLARERRSSDRELLELRAPQIFDLAETGDARAAELLSSTARLLSDALNTMALLYNPKLIVLGGGVGSHGALCRRTEEFLRENEFAVPLVRSSSLGTEAQLFGAVSLSLAAVEAKLLC